MASVLLINGPNLNLLGTREPARYGHQRLDDILERLRTRCAQAGHRFDHLQSNAESLLIDRIHAAATDGTDWIIINPAAFTHTSIALRDALLGVALPFIEVHLSNVYAREAFRHHSYFSDIAQGVIVGFGPRGYDLALDAVLAQLAEAGGTVQA